MNLVPIKTAGLLLLLLAGINVFGLEKDSYLDVAFCGNKFVAVGSRGKIDLVDKTGEITELSVNSNCNLNAVIYSEEKTIIVGDSGTILVSDNLFDFMTLQSGIEENFISIVKFKNDFIATTGNKKILISKNLTDWETSSLTLNGNIVLLSADNNKCFGVSDQGEIISTTDGKNWNVLDYNLQNKGFVKPCFFSGVMVEEKQIVIVGHHDDNSPFALFSNKGNVWIERSLNYEGDDGKPHKFEGIPNDVVFDSNENQYYIACENGDVSILTDCSKCNRAVHLGNKNLKAVAVGEISTVFVGEDYFVKVEY